MRVGNLSPEQEERLKNGDLTVLHEKPKGKKRQYIEGIGWTVKKKKGEQPVLLDKTEDSALRLEWILRNMTDIPVIYEKDWNGQSYYAVREYHFMKQLGLGHEKVRADVALIWARLIIECDGGTQMVVEGEDGGKSVGGAHATDSDRDRNNLIAIIGWRRMSFSPQKLRNDPFDVCWQIYQALGREYVYPI